MFLKPTIVQQRQLLVRIYDVTNTISVATFSTSNWTAQTLRRRDSITDEHSHFNGYRTNKLMQQQQRRSPSMLFFSSSIFRQYYIARYYCSSSPLRLRRINNDNTGESHSNKLFVGLQNSIKKLLPTTWFGSKHEKEQMERKKEVKDRVQGGLDKMLSDAPLAIRFIGKYIVSPMMAKLASNVAESMVEERQHLEKTLDDARMYLLNDDETTHILGIPIQLGRPFQQSSTSISINGRKQNRYEISVEVSGSKSNGIVRIVASEVGIGQLLIELNGKVSNIDLSSKKKYGRITGRKAKLSPNYNGEVIDAEIIDKETKIK